MDVPRLSVLADQLPHNHNEYILFFTRFNPEQGILVPYFLSTITNFIDYERLKQTIPIL